MRCVLRSNAVRAMARWVSRHAPSSMRRRSPSASVAFHRRRHEPAISRGSGITTLVPFCEKYVGEQNVSCADPVGGAAVRAARVTDRCVISATWQPTAPSRTSPGAMTPCRRRPAGPPRRAERPHLVLRVGAQRLYRERLVLPVIARRFAALEQTSHSPEPPLQPSAHRPSARHAPGKHRAAGRAHGMHARLSHERQAEHTPGQGTRGPCAGQIRASKRPRTPLPGRYMSVDSATQGPIALQGDTRRDREETARIAANSQLAGRFRRMWQVVDSNHRRRSRRFTDRCTYPRRTR